MKKIAFIKLLGLLFILFFSLQCQHKNNVKHELKKNVLKQVVYDSKHKELTLEPILHSLRNRVVLLYLWASWCPECDKNLKFINDLKNKYNNDITILFISIDRDIETWITAKKNIKTKGIHFYLGNNLKSPFSKFINLDWIPRYMIIGKDSRIKLFNAESHTDPLIIETLEQEIGR